MERESIWQGLTEIAEGKAPGLDLLIIGGGITGAGILREAARLGLRALLVEQRDFAWGTSSRSSKLVHGGLRYLKEGRIFLTRSSVLERQHLLEEGPGLIDPLGFLLTVYQEDHPGRWTFELGLSVYDLLALQWDHRYYSPQDFRLLAPHVATQNLKGGFRYGDAQTDDARLVLRVIQEAQADGGLAINYVKGESLLRSESGQVCGAVLCDKETGRRLSLPARLVVNATGAWADTLRKEVGAAQRIRPLRGSHLIFPAWRLPAAQAVSFLHPYDQRPVFIFPWEGATLVGTTDVDHGQEINHEPQISPEETAYLMAAVEAQFPGLGLTLDDVLATFAGVRPVIGSGKADPSQESRDHVVWQEAGLLTVTGGKLTTFRLIAHSALAAARSLLPDLPEVSADQPVLSSVQPDLLGSERLDEAIRRRLVGRYGQRAADLLAAAQPGELETIPGTHSLWAELRWAARFEQVQHLEDLLLRRVRLGLLLPQGGVGLLERIREICQPELGWDDGRWQQEVNAYQALWRCCYSLPERASIPDWKLDLLAARERRLAALAQVHKQQKQVAWGLILAAGSLAGLAVLGWLWKRRSARV